MLIMKQALFILCLLTTGLSAQTTTDDYFRARQGYRAGGTNSQLITGFDLSFPGTPTNTKLPTTKAVSDYLNANVLFYGGSSGGDLSGAWPTPRVAEIQDFPVSATDPTEGQVWQLVSGVWTPSTLSTGATYTAGSGIAISGGNEISNTAPNVVQVLGLASNTLSLTNGGGSVDLSPYVNVAAQTLSYSAPNLSISGGNSVDISGNNYWSKATNDLYYTAGNIGIGTASPATKLNIVTNSLGVTQAETAGITVANTTAATNGGQQISPAIGWNALGYGTTAGTSQAVDFRAFVLPVQGTVPTGTWQLQGRIGAGAWTNRMSLASAGDMTLGGGSIILTSTAMVLSENIYKTVNNGVLALYNGGGATSGILLYGTTHATAPNVTAFKNGGAEVARFTATGQLAIGTTSPATSAALDITSTTGALLLPRMTSAQRDALTAANGMVIYNTTTDKVQARAGGAWVDLH